MRSNSLSIDIGVSRLTARRRLKREEALDHFVHGIGLVFDIIGALLAIGKCSCEI